MDILDTVLNILAPIATAVVGWFIGKRKTNAEASQSEIENVEKALGIYRNIIEDLNSKIQALEDRVTTLINRLETVEAENRQLKRQ